jgi:menaquinol-cytochrome c reductase iron-sulfur subunit
MLFTREGFLALVTLTFGGLATIAAAIPILGYAISPYINQPHDVWRDLGPVDSFKIGSTVKVVYDNNAPLEWSGSTAKTGAWLRRNGPDTFTAYAIYCTHLGCR